jgi:hypothetical protein
MLTPKNKGHKRNRVVDPPHTSDNNHQHNNKENSQLLSTQPTTKMQKLSLIHDNLKLRIDLLPLLPLSDEERGDKALEIEHKFDEVMCDTDMC